MNFIKEKISKRRDNNSSFKRIYLIGKEFLKSKFTAGQKFSYIVDFKNKKVKIVPYLDKYASGKGTVSKKKVKEDVIPVLDIYNRQISEVFTGVHSCKITIFDTEIIIEALDNVSISKNNNSLINNITKKVIKLKDIKVKNKILLSKNGLQILLKKASGISGYEQLNLFENYSFTEDNYTKDKLDVIKNNDVIKTDLIETLTYLELFAGGGNGGKALDYYGFKNLYYSEIDKYAIKNYEANYPGRKNLGDIKKIKSSDIPMYNLLIGGAPCQDNSIMKKSGEGLEGDKSSLFFDFERILNTTKPKWFIFENVRGLTTVNNGKDFELVKKLLSKFYNIKWKILNTVHYGIPQTRRRLYIVGQNKELGSFPFEFPKPTGCNITMQDLLERKVDDKYYLTEKMAKTVLSRGTGGWDANPETDMKIARTLCATLFKLHRASQDNYYHTIYHPKDKTNLRRITPREAARAQGNDDDYKIVVSDTQAYKIIGNAMSLNVMKCIVKSLINAMTIPASLRRKLLFHSAKLAY